MKNATVTKSKFSAKEKSNAAHYYDQYVGDAFPKCKEINKESGRTFDKGLEFISFENKNTGMTATFIVENGIPVYFTGQGEMSLNKAFLRVQKF